MDITQEIKVKFHLNGWYAKDNYLKKHLEQQKSVCLLCFDYNYYDDIRYSKILQMNKDNKISFIYCICNLCYNKISLDQNLFIKAPLNIKSVWEIFFEKGKLDCLLNDLKKLFRNDLVELDKQIHQYKFDHNEKLTVINCLQNENKKLSMNLDIEIEKYKLLEQQKIENEKIFKKIRDQFDIFNKSLLEDSNKFINERIELLSQVNNIKKYNTTECKICLNNEVTMVLQCGHLLCELCYNSIIKNIDKENYELIGTSSKKLEEMDIIECPTCRTVSTSCIRVYF